MNNFDEYTDDIIHADIINKLYKLFDDIDEIKYNNDFSYKMIHDTENYFIKIDEEFLNKILEKIPRPKRIKRGD
jgi:hypothetical protein